MSYAKLYMILWSNFSLRNQLQAIFLTALALVVSALEVVSIGSMIPFIALMMGGQINDSLAMPDTIQRITAKFHDVDKIWILAGFVAIILTSTTVRLTTIFLQTSFSFKLGNKMCLRMLDNTLLMDYSHFSAFNSSVYVDGIIRKSGVLMQNIILGAIQLVSNFVIICAICVSLFLVYPETAVWIISFVGIAYALIVFLLTKFTRKISRELSEVTVRALQFLNEIFGNFISLKLDDKRRMVVEQFGTYDIKVRKAEARSLFASIAPRYMMEGIIICFLSVFVFLKSNAEGLSGSDLSALLSVVIMLQRLLPYAQQVYSNVISLKVCKQMFEDTIALLNSESSFEPKKITFENIPEDINVLSIRNLSYETNDRCRLVFDRFNCDITFGKWTAITGKTGSGKSTLLGILLGLIKPNTGTIVGGGRVLSLYNNAQWFQRITFVSQVPFFSDVSLLEAVTGYHDVAPTELNEVHRVLEICLLGEFLDSNGSGLTFKIGENGNRLSGGQRQRLAIAAAIYQKKPILVLDEATNALDTSTQEKLVKNLKTHLIGTTVLMVVHRTEILSFFDQVLNLDEIQEIEK